MHLAINATELGRRRGGNESYLLGLLQGLSDLAVRPHITLLLADAGATLAGNVALKHFAVANMGAYHRLPFYLWQQTAVLHRLRPDWYVSTFFLPPVAPCRTAVLVHDLSFRAHPTYFPSAIALYMRVLTGLAIRQAQRIVTLSEFTRQELARFHPAAVEKAVVVYPGIGREFSAGEHLGDLEVLQSYGLTPGYILALGNIHPRKNLARLLEAYLLLRQRRQGVPTMVWGGIERWDSTALVQRAQAAGVIVPGFIAQKDVPALYRHAAMLIYPSLYEGFGLPPLEAMACGTPVVTSNTTSLPEAVGDAALKVDPTDAEQIAAAMLRLLDDMALREQLRQAGIERARKLTWTRTAQSLLTLLAP